jgi:hypothetical protein
MTIIVHILNEDPIVGEVDEIPSNDDTLILVKNPRRREGGDLHYLEKGVNMVIWPVQRINFVEVMSNEGDEEVISFVRE